MRDLKVGFHNMIFGWFLCTTWAFFGIVERYKAWHHRRKIRSKIRKILKNPLEVHKLIDWQELNVICTGLH